MQLLVRLDAWFYGSVPPERLGLLRLAIGGYSVIYLLSRALHLTAAVRYPASSFAPVGVANLIRDPLPALWVYASVAAALVTGLLFTLGVAYRFVAPLFALLLCWVMSYRHSWGMIFHTDNLLVLHVALLAMVPCADAYALPFTRQLASKPAIVEPRHGWVVRSMCLVTVAAYLVAGLAKIEHTGWSWAGGDALREQVAYDAIRKIELGSVYSPIGTWLLPHTWLFAPLSTFALATELLAPLALLGVRSAAVWAAAAWLFHLGVLALMAIAFPYPLSGCAFLGFFPLERMRSALLARRRKARSPRATPPEPERAA